jgi:hypothetical protein
MQYMRVVRGIYERLDPRQRKELTALINAQRQEEARQFLIADLCNLLLRRAHRLDDADEPRNH